MYWFYFFTLASIFQFGHVSILLSTFAIFLGGLKCRRGNENRWKIQSKWKEAVNLIHLKNFTLKNPYFSWFHDKTNPKIGLYVKSWPDISPPITISTLVRTKLSLGSLNWWFLKCRLQKKIFKFKWKGHSRLYFCL